jgi:hypothetical protein
MKVDSLTNEPSPIGSSERDSLSGVAVMVKDVLTRNHLYADEDKISYWQLIFLQSKANGCSYRGENLPHMKWRWPKGTWFQEQLSRSLREVSKPWQSVQPEQQKSVGKPERP